MFDHQAWLERPYEEAFARSEAIAAADEALIDDDEWTCPHHGTHVWYLESVFRGTDGNALLVMFACETCEHRVLTMAKLTIAQVLDDLATFDPAAPTYAMLREPCEDCQQDWFAHEEERAGEAEIAAFEDRMAYPDDPPSGWEP